MRHVIKNSVGFKEDLVQIYVHIQYNGTERICRDDVTDIDSVLTHSTCRFRWFPDVSSALTYVSAL